MPEASAGCWLILPIVAPLAAALAAFVCGRLGTAWIGMATVLIVLVATGKIVWQVANHGRQVYALGNWSAPLGIELRADGLSCAMLLMSAVVGTFVCIYALGYFREFSVDGALRYHPSELYWPLWLLLWSALHALFLSGDLFNLYVTLELLTLAAIGLVVLARKRVAVEAALRYLVAALAGSLLYLAGVVVIYGAYGTLDLVSLNRQASSEGMLEAALLLMTLGLMLKTALFPLHFWLPPAHSSAPAPVSAVLSGLVIKGSLYMLLRLWFEVFPADVVGQFAMLPLTLGAAAIVWGSVQALHAARLKLLVAYSTVAQLGYLFLVLGLADRSSENGLIAWSAGVLFAMAHACAKGAMFLAAGIILLAAGHDRIHELSGVARRLPITFAAMGVACVNLMGLPPTGAFVAKWELLQAAIAGSHHWLAVIIVVGGLLAAAYLFRVLQAAFVRPSGEIQHYRRPSRLLEYTTLGLATLSLVLGFAAEPVARLVKIGSPWSVTVQQREATP